MANLTITAVSDNVRDWASTQGGPMKGYRVTVQDDAGVATENVEWSRKATSPAPTVGQKVDAIIDTSGQYGPKLKVTPTGGGFGGGGGRPRDPAERRSIEMQHAQKCAVEAIRVAAQFGDYKPPSVGDIASHVKTIARVLYEQCEEVSKA